MKRQAEEIKKAQINGLESCLFCDFSYIPNPDDKVFLCQNEECLKEICRYVCIIIGVHCFSYFTVGQNVKSCNTEFIFF